MCATRQKSGPLVNTRQNCRSIPAGLCRICQAAGGRVGGPCFGSYTLPQAAEVRGETRKKQSPASAKDATDAKEKQNLRRSEASPRRFPIASFAVDSGFCFCHRARMFRNKERKR